MAIRDGGARSFMASYNKWNGVPMLLHPTAKTVLAGEWGLDGIFSTDLAAVGNLVNHQKHVATIDEALAATIKAGYGQLLWFAMMDGAELREVLGRILAGKLVTEADIDAALRGKFRTLIRLGLLDPPARRPTPASARPAIPSRGPPTRTRRWRATWPGPRWCCSRTPAARCRSTRAALKSIAVIGPRADNVMTDFYGGPTPYAVSVLDGIKAKLGAAATVTHADGSDVGRGGDRRQGGQRGRRRRRQRSDVRRDEPDGDVQQGRLDEAVRRQGHGPGRARSRIARAQRRGLIKQVFAANPKTIVVLVSSFPYAITWSQANVPAILHITHAAQEQGTAIADVLFGDYNPAVT